MSTVRDSLKLFELRDRFKVAVDGTRLSRSSSFREINSEGIVSVYMTISNENNYPITVKMQFTNITDLETFVEMMEKLKEIAMNPDYQVQLIPHSNRFDIYINGEQVLPTSLSYYCDRTKWNLKNSISEVFFDIRSEARRVSYLWHQVNDKQANIDYCMDLVGKLDGDLPLAEKKNLINFKRVGEFGTILSIDDYEIDWNAIMKAMDEYDKAFSTNDKNARNIFEDNLLEEFKQIIETVKAGKSIAGNSYDIPNDVSAKQLHFILNFLNKLLEMLKDMQLNAASILDYKSEQFANLASTINEALSKGKKEAIEAMAVIRISDSDIPKDYQPKIDSSIIRVPYAVYDKGSFNVEMDTKAEVFNEIQKQQMERLTQDERDALIYYKSSMYRPINKVVAFIRERGLSLQDIEKDESLYREVLDIISKCYDEFINRKEEIKKDDSPFAVMARVRAKQNKIPAVERLFGIYPDDTPSESEYIRIVLNSIPLLGSALSKVEAPEDMVVYRGTAKGTSLVNDGRFLSTSCSLNVARDFLGDDERVNSSKCYCPDIYQIVIPKGSPLIVFTDDLFMDRIEDGRVFDEVQSEILIDPFNYDFKIKYVNSEHIADGTLVSRVNYVAVPKAMERNQMRAA